MHQSKESYTAMVSGYPRDNIALENNTGAGTVTNLVNDYKIGLKLRVCFNQELAVEIRKQGLNLSQLASHFRLYKFFIKSGQQRTK
jgi:hypothetical protein